MNNSYFYLTMISGPRSGTNFLLDPEITNRLGRGIDCDIVLVDPMCSRVHAELDYKEDRWWLKDTGSRNGTYVNDHRVDTVPLTSGVRVRMGSSEFAFHSSDQPPTLAATRDKRMTESIVREAPVESEDSGRLALASLRHANNAHELMVLFQLSVHLLGCDDPHDVLRSTLELIHDRTSAGVVGFLWITDDGELKPQMLVPPEAEGQTRLSESLTKIVLEQRRAVWIANQAAAANAESLKGYADAVCVPVIHGGQILGAIHLYLSTGRFLDLDFEFAISVSQVLAVALARSRRQAILAADHQRLVDSSAACSELLGESAVMQKLTTTIKRVAAASGCVLVAGESGSGKELVARAIHRASPRADRPLLAVNCAAIPENLVESQLFGHLKGAFTGATANRVGWFQQRTRERCCSMKSASFHRKHRANFCGCWKVTPSCRWAAPEKSPSMCV